MNAGSMLILFLAIVSEVVGTVALKASEGFARLGPTALVVVGYGLTFYFLGLSPSSTYRSASPTPSGPVSAPPAPSSPGC